MILKVMDMPPARPATKSHVACPVSRYRTSATMPQVARNRLYQLGMPSEYIGRVSAAASSVAVAASRRGAYRFARYQTAGIQSTYAP